MKLQNSDLPPALPDEVVDQILNEIFQDKLSKDDRKSLRDQLKNGSVRLNQNLVETFVEISIDHPHYANGKEIANAINETMTRVHHFMIEAKYKARKNRIF
jgi:hypothetical protein